LQHRDRRIAQLPIAVRADDREGRSGSRAATKSIEPKSGTKSVWNRTSARQSRNSLQLVFVNLPKTIARRMTCYAGRQIEGKRYSVGHGGCGAPLVCDAIRLNTDLLRESLVLRHSRHINLSPHA
jgi:hypothetical protein